MVVITDHSQHLLCQDFNASCRSTDLSPLDISSQAAKTPTILAPGMSSGTNISHILVPGDEYLLLLVCLSQ